MVCCARRLRRVACQDRDSLVLTKETVTRDDGVHRAHASGLSVGGRLLQRGAREVGVGQRARVHAHLPWREGREGR